MNAVMRRSMCVVMLLLVVARAAIAQDLFTISGVVTTRTDGMPVPGAIVSVVGADASVTTDTSGSYIRADVNEPFDVDIRLRVDPSVTSRRVTDRLKLETEAIWRPYGIQLKWTEAGPSEPAAKSVALDASLERRFERRQDMKWPAVLGSAVVQPDAPTGQPIRVSFDATERVLALRETRRPAMAGIVLDPELARALGRVLAHEIGHVLLGAPYHDRGGLMRASFRPEELGEPDRSPFRLTCGSVGRLRSRLRVLTGEPQLFRQRGSTTLDLERLPGASEASSAASCIVIQPAR